MPDAIESAFEHGPAAAPGQPLNRSFSVTLRTIDSTQRSTRPAWPNLTRAIESNAKTDNLDMLSEIHTRGPTVAELGRYAGLA